MDANRPWMSRAVLAAVLLFSIVLAWPTETSRAKASRLTVAQRALQKSSVIALGAHLDLIEARLADAELALALQDFDPRDLGGDGCIPARGLGSCVY